MDRTNDGVVIYRSHMEKFVDEFLWSGAFGTSVPGIIWVFGLAVLVIIIATYLKKKGR
jgi:hypothetical protein